MTSINFIILILYQEHHHVSVSINHSSIHSIISATRRTNTYQYENRAFEPDPSNGYTQSANGQIPVVNPSRSTSRISQIEAGRTQLHRLLDEVLDKAEPDQQYDPESESERQQRRRQRRRIHSASYDPRNPLIHNDEQQIPHTPMIANVSERPDPALLRLYNNPYQAGDYAHEIQRATPAVSRSRYASDDQDIEQHYPQSSYRSNPPLFYDDSNIPNRPVTTTDSYNTRRHPDTDRNGFMPLNGQRQHRFDQNAVYIDTIPKTRDGARVPVHNAWSERDNRPNGDFFHLDPSDVTNDYPPRNDYRDEYMMAKRSVVSTKNLISSIHDELQQIVSPSSTDSHLV